MLVCVCCVSRWVGGVGRGRGGKYGAECADEGAGRVL